LDESHSFCRDNYLINSFVYVRKIMNIRKVIFAGIITALIGSMFGLAITKISGREERKKILLVSGATLGFVIGTFQESIQQQKKLRDDEYGDVDSWK
jgi:gas vesicle protein